jgi:hypothetical protein
MKSFVITALVVLLAVGCKEGPASGSHVSGYNTAVNTVLLLESGLSKPLAVEEHFGRRNATGSLEVLVTLRNRTRGPLPVEVRASFLDRDRHGAGQPSAWRPVNMQPLSTQQYTEFSLTPDAAFYMVEVRFAERR